MGKRTIYVVEDNESFRASLAQLLRVSGGFNVVEFASASVLLRKLRAPLPQCMIVDLHMPGIDGLGLIAALQARRIIIPIIVLSAYASLETAVQSAKMGASVVLRKPCAPVELLHAIEQCCNEARTRASSAPTPVALAPDSLDWESIAQRLNLSRRQREISMRICESMTNDQIADDLSISSNTVRMHVKVLYQKLDVHDRVGVVLRCASADSLTRNGIPATALRN